MLSQRYASPFAVIRCPSLPINHLLLFWEKLRSGNTQLDELIDIYRADPQLLEALYIASPDLYDALTQLNEPVENRRKSDPKKVVQSLLKYFIRATSRATPYGLFAGCATFTAEKIQLNSDCLVQIVKPERSQGVCRFDMDFLTRLSHDLILLPALQPFFTYLPNTSLYRTGTTWRYVEYSYEASERQYQLVRVENTEFLSLLLERARVGASFDALMAAGIEYGFERDDVDAYLHELVSSQILVPDILPNVTGEPFQQVLFARIDEWYRQVTDESVRQRLACLLRAYQTLQSLRQQPTATPGHYEQIIRCLEASQFRFDRSKVFQVDSIYEAVQLSVTPVFAAEISEVLTLLRRVAASGSESPIQRFQRAFVERYETSEVPLALALDPEIGIPFLPDSEASAGVGGKLNSSYPMKLYRKALRDKLYEIRLEDEDWAFSDQDPEPDHASFSIIGGLVRHEGVPVFVWQGAGGPTAINLLARFSQADKALQAELSRVAQWEQQLYPRQILAEVAHLPEGRTGNILSREHARLLEIPYMVASTRSPENTIAIDDLTLKYQQGRLQLRSRSRQQEIIPMLSTAHNFNLPESLPIYRFLGQLQLQATQSQPLNWDWKFLDQEPFLPRLRYKNIIVSLATWHIPSDELLTLIRRYKTDALQAIEAIRNQYNLPRYVSIVEGDNTLMLDMAVRESVDLLAERCRTGDYLKIQENLLGDGEGWVYDETGNSYAAELIIPMIRKAPALPETPDAPPQKAKLPDKPSVGSPRQKYLPGVDWVYLKIYAGLSATDQLLTEVIGPLCAQLEKRRYLSGWFFVRYADPDNHLRVRVKLTQARHLGNIILRMNQKLQPYVDAEIVSKIMLDTYVPEIDRYGEETMVLSEEVFYHNSRCVVDLLTYPDLLAEDPLQSRRLQAVFVLDGWLSVLGWDVNRRLKLVEALHAYFEAEIPDDEREELKTELSRTYRTVKDMLFYLITTQESETLPESVMDLFAVRQRFLTAVDPVMTSIGAHFAEQTEAFEALMASYLHVFINRCFPARQRIEEYRVYDLYRRALLASKARLDKRR